MKANTPLVLATIALAAANGCARLVVVEPNAVDALNEEGWRIQQRRPQPMAKPEPRRDDPAPSSGATAPEPAQATNATAAPAGVPAPAMPPPLAAPRKLRPAALATPPDARGIPAGLYDHDPLLRSYETIAKARASSHRTVGAAKLVVGAVVGVLSGVILHAAAASDREADLARSRGYTVTNDPSGTQYFFGTVEAVLAVGIIAAGIVELSTGTDTRALERYTRETYGVP